MKVTIAKGESLIVNLEGTDGEFIITYGQSVLSVTADLPDTDGREGVIYSERFGADDDDDEDTVDNVRPPKRPVPTDEEVVIGRFPKLPRAAPRKRASANSYLPKNTKVALPSGYYSKMAFASRRMFLENLALVEASPLTRQIPAELVDHCNNCDDEESVTLDTNGDSFRTDNDVQWPKALRHHVEKHGWRPPRWFINYIANKAVN